MIPLGCPPVPLILRVDESERWWAHLFVALQQFAPRRVRPALYRSPHGPGLGAVGPQGVWVKDAVQADLFMTQGSSLEALSLTEAGLWFARVAPLRCI
ncbi:hypothetical protein MRX96_048975 [Rhipicephalus microplus]